MGGTSRPTRLDGPRHRRTDPGRTYPVADSSQWSRSVALVSRSEPPDDPAVSGPRYGAAIADQDPPHAGSARAPSADRTKECWTVNKVLLTGRLTRDPEMRALASGKHVTQFSVATTEYAGNGKERPEFHNIVTWDRLGCAT